MSKGPWKNHRPEPERRARNRAARSRARDKYDAEHANELAEKKAEKKFRFQSKVQPEVFEDGRTIVSEGQLRQPRFWWIDPHGVLHPEFLESPEELIERLTALEKRGPPQ